VPAWFSGATGLVDVRATPCVSGRTGRPIRGEHAVRLLAWARNSAGSRRPPQPGPRGGELNSDRSNHPYDIAQGELRLYGACDFEAGGPPKVAEPRESVRDTAARIWLYMSETYGIPPSEAERAMFEEWAAADPVDRCERLRDAHIEAAQGSSNAFVRP